MENRRIYFNSKTNRVAAILLVADAVLNLSFLLLNIFYLNFTISSNQILVSVSITIFLPVLLAFGVYKKNNPTIVLSFFYTVWHFYTLYSLLKNVGYVNFSKQPIFIVHLSGVILQTLIAAAIFVCLIILRMEREKFIRDTTTSQF